MTCKNNHEDFLKTVADAGPHEGFIRIVTEASSDGECMSFAMWCKDCGAYWGDETDHKWQQPGKEVGDA